MSVSSIKKIKFSPNHKPVLKDGVSTIKISQELLGRSFTTEQKVIVSGERFSFSSDLIHNVFPPAGSSGDYSNLLPHIVLNRSTLPWERSPQNDQSDTNAPWLILLLFDEKIPVQQMTLEQLTTTPPAQVSFPILRLEEAQHKHDIVKVIDIKKDLWEKVIPSVNDLHFLAHVRESLFEGNHLSPLEKAIIIGNRLPPKIGTAYAYLVSIENRFDQNGFLLSDASDETIRLVCLYDWNFMCFEKKQDLKHILKQLDQQPFTLQLPKINDPHIKNGKVPVSHYFRQGDQLISWYHGPLLPGANIQTITFPIKTSDALIQYSKDIGMFDMSYAAAWELGRILALKDTKFSIDLFHWKRGQVQKVKQETQLELHKHLPFEFTTPSSEIPNGIVTWFNDLSILKNVPFNYLVPEENMLPEESIRFFQVDQTWIRCMLEGAFSIGGVSALDQSLKSEIDFFKNTNKKLSGFLIRSQEITGWPDLQIDAKVIEQSNSEFRTPIRMDQLAPNILICLFDEIISEVNIHQKPESLHLGLDKEGASFKKILRKKNTEDENIRTILNEEKSPWLNLSTRVLSISALASEINKKARSCNASSEFAYEMIEGVELVNFKIN